MHISFRSIEARGFGSIVVCAGHLAAWRASQALAAKSDKNGFSQL